MAVSVLPRVVDQSSGGKVVETNNCHCGHVKDEHGGDPIFKGSTACGIEDCDCISYEWDGEEDE